MTNVMIIFIIAFILTQLNLILKLIEMFSKNKGINKNLYILNKIVVCFSTPFMLVNTLVHEIGHVITSVLTRGKVYNINLFKDTSGSALTGSNKFHAKFLTSMAGYPFASLVALFFSYLLVNDKSYFIVYILVALLLVSIVFYVRNLFGIVWSVSFLSLLLVIDSYASDEILTLFLTFVVCVIVVDSFMSAVYIFFVSIFDVEKSGDCLNLSKLTKLPALFYGIFFVSQASIIFYYSVSIFYKTT